MTDKRSLTGEGVDLEELKEVYALFRSLYPEQPDTSESEEREIARLEAYNPYFSRYRYRLTVGGSDEKTA